jgi:hypothetical protein
MYLHSSPATTSAACAANLHYHGIAASWQEMSNTDLTKCCKKEAGPCKADSQRM